MDSAVAGYYEHACAVETPRNRIASWIYSCCPCLSAVRAVKNPLSTWSGDQVVLDVGVHHNVARVRRIDRDDVVVRTMASPGCRRINRRERRPVSALVRRHKTIIQASIPR